MTQIINIRNEIVTTDPTDIRRIIKKTYEQFHLPKCDNIKKWADLLKMKKKHNKIINNLNGTFLFNLYQ